MYRIGTQSEHLVLTIKRQDAHPTSFLTGTDRLLSSSGIKAKKCAACWIPTSCTFEAEREGFEPPEVLPSTVFKTAAIDHSAISPVSITPVINSRQA